MIKTTGDLKKVLKEVPDETELGNPRQDRTGWLPTFKKGRFWLSPCITIYLGESAECNVVIQSTEGHFWTEADLRRVNPRVSRSLIQLLKVAKFNCYSDEMIKKLITIDI